MPRSRSTGRKSVVVLPVSTVPGDEIYEDFKSIDSVSVVFPESCKKDSQTMSLPKCDGSTHLCEPRGPYFLFLMGHDFL